MPQDTQDPLTTAERRRYAEIAADREMSARQAVAAIFAEFSRERPEVVALWSFGIGFVLGWKLKLKLW